MSVLADAMKALRLDPSSDDVAMTLVREWGNETFAADISYMRAVIDRAVATSGEILECGSGATTLALAAVAPGRVTTLENSYRWRRGVQTALAAVGMQNDVRLRWSPLRPYGSDRWYSRAPRDRMYGLVICDGPPGHRGGRFGLLPVMRNQLAVGCEVLLDDVGREQERIVADRWCSEYGLTLESVETDRGLAVLTVPS